MNKWRYVYCSDINGFRIYQARQTLPPEQLDEAFLLMEKQTRHYETAENIVSLLNQLLDYNILDIGHDPKS